MFDSNDAGKFSDEARMDRAVTAAYEPGSTFKVITMTGAIENRVTNPDVLVDCQMGSILVAGRLIHDWHPFGVLSVRDVLAAFQRCGLHQDRTEHGRATFLRHDAQIRNRPAHRNRIARRKSRPACVLWKIGRPVRSGRWPSGRKSA